MMGFNGGTTYTSLQSFQSKADALHYAIEFTATLACDGGRKAEYVAAQELYDFICKNVQLPDVAPNPMDEITHLLRENIASAMKDKATDQDSH